MKKRPPPLPGSIVVTEEPYRFVPPKDSRFWPWFVSLWLERYLSSEHGIESWDLSGAEHIHASRRAGHGIMIVPNHSRPSDPMAMGLAVMGLKQLFYALASAHLFSQGRIQKLILSGIGAFSVYREGSDRQALKASIDILAHARRPLVLFGEGVVTRTNDRIIPLQEGIPFIARAAAKERAAATPPGRVVVHPMAVRYTFRGDIEKWLPPVLDRVEARLSWQPQRGIPLVDRLEKISLAWLTMKEIEYFGSAQSGGVAERHAGLVERILSPMEDEWLKGRRDGDPIDRLKNLRKAILPGLVAGTVGDAERLHRWRQLLGLELVQLIYNFPPDYLREAPTPERMIETIERCEEILGSPHPAVPRPLHMHFEMGEAIPVDPARDRRATSDPLLDQVRTSLQLMLGIRSAAT